MDSKNTILDHKLLGVLLGQIIILRTDLEITESINEALLEAVLPERASELYAMMKVKREGLLLTHYETLLDRLELESDQMADLLSNLLSK